SSPAAKAVVDELLRVIKELDYTKLRVPAIKSIGSLARSFLARQSRVIGPLVARLGNTDQDVAMEAAIALKNFVSTCNYLCSEHSKSIIEFEGVPFLMKDLNCGRGRVFGRIAFIAVADITDAIAVIAAGALTALQTIDPEVITEYRELETLVPHTISKLQSYLTVEQQQTESSTGIKQFFTKQSKAVVATIGGAMPPLKTRRIQQFLKVKCMELALISVYYLKKRLVIKEPAQKLRFPMKPHISVLPKKANEVGFHADQEADQAVRAMQVAAEAYA
ncbi:hypothetical protein Goshw_001544, partial [Gossypium schwendimanii]|nr:hypothetical protein [Gossypium schwendimanii]